MHAQALIGTGAVLPWLLDTCVLSLFAENDVILGIGALLGK